MIQIKYLPYIVNSSCVYWIICSYCRNSIVATVIKKEGSTLCHTIATNIFLHNGAAFHNKSYLILKECTKETLNIYKALPLLVDFACSDQQTHVKYFKLV